MLIVIQVYLYRSAARRNAMKVQLEADNEAAYFNIVEPGDKPSETGAIYISSTDGNNFAGTLRENGDYLKDLDVERVN